MKIIDPFLQGRKGEREKSGIVDPFLSQEDEEISAPVTPVTPVPPVEARQEIPEDPTDAEFNHAGEFVDAYAGRLGEVFVDPIQRGFNRFQQGAAYVAGSPEAIAAQQEDLNELGKSERLENLERAVEGKGWLGTGKEMLSSPLAMIELTSEALSQSIPSIIGGAVTGLIGGSTLGPLGALGGTMTGAGLGSFGTEYTSMMTEAIEAAGYDLADPDSIRAAFENPSLMEAARERAIGKGWPVAVFDALSMGIAGRIGKPITRLASKGDEAGDLAKLAGGTAEVGTQGLLGGAGEAAGSMNIGDEVSPYAVLAEAFGELLPGTAEAGVNVISDRLFKREGAPQQEAPPNDAQTDPLHPTEGVAPEPAPEDNAPVESPVPAPSASAPISAGETPHSPVGEQEGSPISPTARQPVSFNGETNATVTTSRGNKVDTSYDVYEADQLITSDNENYPQEAQPRDRGKGASDVQVADIAANLDPGRLGASSEADRGAPIVREDGVVLSGNGRIMAIRKAYEEDGEAADRYRTWATEQLGVEAYEFGENPIIVRRVSNDMTPEQQQAFVIEANEASTMQMSETERANADAKLLDGRLMDMLDNADLSQAGNSDFVAAFLGQVGKQDLNAFTDGEGKLSNAGARRIRNAIMAKAYGGSENATTVLGQFLESPDNNFQQIGNGLLEAAPAYAQMLERFRDHKVWDITPSIIDAVQAASQVRESGQSVGQWLSQIDIDRPPSLLTDTILKTFYDNNLNKVASSKRIATVMKYYAQEAAKQEGTFIIFDDTITPEDILNEGKRRAYPEAEQGPQGGLFKADGTDEGNAPGGQGAGGQGSATEGGRAGAETAGNETAGAEPAGAEPGDTTEGRAETETAKVGGWDKYVSDRKMALDDIVIHGDNASSPYLLADGTIIETYGDHSDAIEAYYDSQGETENKNYRDFQKDTGAIRAGFWHEKGQLIVSVQLFGDQRLTKEQENKLKAMEINVGSLRDSPSDKMVVMAGVSSLDGDGHTNPEYAKPVTLSEFLYKHGPGSATEGLTETDDNEFEVNDITKVERAKPGDEPSYIELDTRDRQKYLTPYEGYAQPNKSGVYEKDHTLTFPAPKTGDVEVLVHTTEVGPDMWRYSTKVYAGHGGSQGPITAKEGDTLYPSRADAEAAGLKSASDSVAKFMKGDKGKATKAALKKADQWIEEQIGERAEVDPGDTAKSDWDERVESTPENKTYNNPPAKIGAPAVYNVTAEPVIATKLEDGAWEVELHTGKKITLRKGGQGLPGQKKTWFYEDNKGGVEGKDWRAALTNAFREYGDAKMYAPDKVAKPKTLAEAEDQGFDTTTVYYHATPENREYAKFIPGGPKNVDSQAGIFFTPDAENQPMAHHGKAKQVMPVYLKMESTWVYDTNKKRKTEIQDWEVSEVFPLIISADEVAQMKARGYDSIRIIPNEGFRTPAGFKAPEEVIVFDDSQILTKFTEDGGALGPEVAKITKPGPAKPDLAEQVATKAFGPRHRIGFRKLAESVPAEMNQYLEDLSKFYEPEDSYQDLEDAINRLDQETRDNIADAMNAPGSRGDEFIEYITESVYEEGVFGEPDYDTDSQPSKVEPEPEPPKVIPARSILEPNNLTEAQQKLWDLAISNDLDSLTESERKAVIESTAYGKYYLTPIRGPQMRSAYAMEEKGYGKTFSIAPGGFFFGIPKIEQQDKPPKPDAGQSYDLQTPAESSRQHKNTRIPKGGLAPDFEEVSFTKRASMYDQAFIDAGVKPGEARNRTTDWQIKTLTRLFKDKFNVEVIVPADALKREAIDQMLDAYQNMQNMLHVLGLPLEALSHQGQLKIVMERFNGGYLGMFNSETFSLHMPGRSNSFAHEWMHSLDAYLANTLTDTEYGMLSRSVRYEGLSNDPQSTEEAFVKLMNAVFFDTGKLEEARKLLYFQMTGVPEAQAILAGLTPGEKDTKTARDAARQMEEIQRGSSQLIKVKNDYYAGVNAWAKMKHMDPSYWVDPAEMLARSFEAYVANKVTEFGGTNEFLSKGEWAYLNNGNSRMAFSFPKMDTRADIFSALDQLFGYLGIDYLTGKAGGDLVGPRQVAPPAKGDPVKPGYLLNYVHPTKDDRKVVERMSEGFDDWKKAFKGFVQDAMGGKSELKGSMRFSPLTANYRFAQVIAASQGGMLRSIANKYNSNAMHRIARMLSTDPGSGQLAPLVFEEQATDHYNVMMNTVTDIMRRNNLSKITPELMRVLRDVMVSALDPGHVPANIAKAAGELRQLLDNEWYRNRQVGIILGYTKNGYLQRLMNYDYIFNNPEKFKKAAAEVYGVQFDNTVGTDATHEGFNKDKFLQAAKNVRSPDFADQLKPLLKVIRRLEAKLKTAIENGAELDSDVVVDLNEQINELINTALPELKKAYSMEAAEAWNSRIAIGSSTDFDTRGPDSNYVLSRVLPPEADTILREFLNEDPIDAISQYMMRSSRRVEFTRRFGVGGVKLDKMMEQAHKEGVHPLDIRTAKGLVESVTGSSRTGQMMRTIEAPLGVAYAIGTMQLLETAMMTSIAEPLVAFGRTKQFRDLYAPFARMMGEVMKTEGSRQRAEVARAVGLVVDAQFDMLVQSRLAGDMPMGKAMQRLTTNFFERTMLSPLTRAQMRGMTGTAHKILIQWASIIADKDADPVKKSIAEAEFLELGLPLEFHADFAEWIMRGEGSMPNAQEIHGSRAGQYYATAVNRMVGQIIQRPQKVDRPFLAQVPVLRVMYGIMSYQYQFWKNYIKMTAKRAERDRKIAIEHGAKYHGAGSYATSMGMAAASLGALTIGHTLVSIPREFFLNRDKWDEKEEEDQLLEWLIARGFARTGITGPTDPVVNAFTGIRYQRDLAGLLAGPQIGYWLQQTQTLVGPLLGRNSPNNLNSERKSVEALYRLTVQPVGMMLLSMTPGTTVGNLFGFLIANTLGSNAIPDAVNEVVLPESEKEQAKRERKERAPRRRNKDRKSRPTR